MSNPAPHTVPKGASQPKRQVAMFVANNMVSDRRVIREATTVAAAGFAVTVHAIVQGPERLPEPCNFNDDGARAIDSRHHEPPYEDG